MPQDYYQLLGVSETASSEEIEAAFRDRASEVHPDRVPAGNLYLKSVAAEAFKRLSEAKAVLSDPGKRQKYDQELARSRSRSAAKRTAAAAAATSGFTTTPPAGTARKSPPARPGSAVLAVLVCGVLVWAVWLGMSL